MKKGCLLCNCLNFKLLTKIVWPVQECLNCHLVQVYPRPSEKEVTSLYHGDYYKNYQPYLSQIETHKKYFNNRVNEIKKIIKTGRILDVGCALGAFLEAAKEQGLNPLGIDISSYAVNYCKKRGLSAITGQIGSIKKNNCFDVVVAFDTIEHERDPLAMVKKTYALLKNGGLVVYTTPNYNHWTRPLLGKFWPGYRHREHLYFFTPETLRALFEKANFINIVIQKDENRSYPISYWFRRSADYFRFPLLKNFLILFANLFSKTKFSLPINPWGNIIIYAQKNNQ